MILKKITVGFVIQSYDTTTNKFISQDFTAADEVTWETENGNQVDAPDTNNGDISEPYLNFDMVQPIA